MYPRILGIEINNDGYRVGNPGLNYKEYYNLGYAKKINFK